MNLKKISENLTSDSAEMFKDQIKGVVGRVIITSRNPSSPWESNHVFHLFHKINKPFKKSNRKKAFMDNFPELRICSKSLFNNKDIKTKNLNNKFFNGLKILYGRKIKLRLCF